MIHTKNFQTFQSIITDLKTSNVQIKLLGNAAETFRGAVIGFEKPNNNYLRVCIIALTTIGTICYSNDVKLADSDDVNNIKTFLDQFSVIPADISYDKETGNVEIK